MSRVRFTKAAAQLDGRHLYGDVRPGYGYREVVRIHHHEVTKELVHLQYHHSKLLFVVSCLALGKTQGQR